MKGLCFKVRSDSTSCSRLRKLVEVALVGWGEMGGRGGGCVRHGASFRLFCVNTVQVALTWIISCTNQTQKDLWASVVTHTLTMNLVYYLLGIYIYIYIGVVIVSYGQLSSHHLGCSVQSPLLPPSRNHFSCCNPHYHIVKLMLII